MKFVLLTLLITFSYLAQAQERLPGVFTYQGRA
jgi:hypothetical protein